MPTFHVVVRSQREWHMTFEFTADDEAAAREAVEDVIGEPDVDDAVIAARFGGDWEEVSVDREIEDIEEVS
jgi:hypothetical protein